MDTATTNGLIINCGLQLLSHSSRDEHSFSPCMAVLVRNDGAASAHPGLQCVAKGTSQRAVAAGCWLLLPAACRSHGRLKPLLRKPGPSWRPSAVRRPASTCNFVLSLARTFQANVPLTFFLQSCRQQPRARRNALLSLLGNYRLSARHLEANLADRGHQAAKSRATGCNPRYAVWVTAPIRLPRRAGHVIHALSGSAVRRPS